MPLEDSHANAGGRKGEIRQPSAVLTSGLAQETWTAALGETILILTSFRTRRAGEENPIQQRYGMRGQSNYSAPVQATKLLMQHLCIIIMH